MSQRFDANNLPSDPEGWEQFVKVSPTKATRIDGPFTVATDDGQEITCQDGWLAMDSREVPFPIPAAVFSEIYRPKDA